MHLKIFTWHIHGSYLFYLSQGEYTIYTPGPAKKEEGDYGLGSTFPFGSNVIEVPAEEVRHLSFDVILFQTNKNWLRISMTFSAKSSVACPEFTWNTTHPAAIPRIPGTSWTTRTSLWC